MKCKRILSLALAAFLTAAICFSGCQNNSADINAEQSESSVEAEVSEKVSASESKAAEESSGKAAESKTETSLKENSDSSEASVSQNTITPKVWEIKDEDGNVMYMMGTIHLGNEEIMHMPDYFESTFAGCDALAVECDTTKMAMDLTQITKLMYTDKSTIKEHVSEEDYQKAVEILSGSSMYNQMYEYMKPIMWISLGEVAAASNVGLTENYGVDKMLINRAYKEGKSVLEVEGAEFQTEILTSIPDEIQELLFHEMANTENYMEEMEKSMTELYANWEKGEEIASDEEVSMEESLTEEQQEFVDEYNRIMLVDRNKGMADKAEEYIKSEKTTFMAVGSAHFYGENGILQLMEDRGYSVRALSSEDASMQKASEQSKVTEVTDVSTAETDPAVPKAA